MNPQYFIKIGGSLMRNTTKLSIALSKIIKIYGTKIIATVGSGCLGDCYKNWIKTENALSLPSSFSTRNWALIQLINSNVIAGIDSRFSVCHNDRNIYEALQSGHVPLINPYGYSEELRSLKLPTSDLKAAYLCNRFSCKELVIVTDVNGIYTDDPKQNIYAEKIIRINAEDLVQLGKTSVDCGLAELLIKYRINCRVIGIDDLLSDTVQSVYSIGEHCTTIFARGDNDEPN